MRNLTESKSSLVFAFCTKDSQSLQSLVLSVLYHAYIIAVLSRRLERYGDRDIRQTVSSFETIGACRRAPRETKTNWAHLSSHFHPVQELEWRGHTQTSLRGDPEQNGPQTTIKYSRAGNNGGPRIRLNVPVNHDSQEILDELSIDPRSLSR